MAKICHGCITKNADGSNRLIGPGKKNALFQLTNAFGKLLRTLKAKELRHEVVLKKNVL